MGNPNTQTEYFLEFDQDRTDNSLASRFIDRNQDLLRYVPEWNKFLIWDSRRWKIDFQGVGVQKQARQFVESLWRQLGLIAQKDIERGTLDRIRTFIKSCNDSKRINGITTLSRSDNRILIEFPNLNSDPYLLNVQNGTYDFESGDFRDHDPDDNITQLANVDFDPSATCPKWVQAMNLIFDDDYELVEYVQKLIGYSVTGDTGEHILPISYGNGENGKSVIWNTLVGIFGDYAALANDGLVMGSDKEHATEKATLYQKRFVAISEPEQNARLKEARVKELSGDEWITARRMREDFWTFKRTHTLWIATNHLPSIRGTDHGIWRRIKLIPFNVRIRDKVKPNKNFVSELIKDESSGILNWCLEGYRKYVESGMDEPRAVIEATKAFRNESNEMSQWIEECCVTGGNVFGIATELFESFKEWNNASNLTQVEFGKDLSILFGKKRKHVNGTKTTIYEGIGLKASNQDENDLQNGIHDTPETENLQFNEPF